MSKILAILGISSLLLVGCQRAEPEDPNDYFDNTEQQEEISQDDEETDNEDAVENEDAEEPSDDLPEKTTEVQ